LDPSMSGTRWKLSLNIGREPGTAMPASWAASGARLVFPVDVDFELGACDSSIRPVEETLIDRPVRGLTPLGPASFVGMHGEEHVNITPGGWSATEMLEQATRGRADAPGVYALRFFLDFPEGARRNDVDCPPGRMFFTTGFWDAAALIGAQDALADASQQLQALEEQILEVQIEARENANPLARAAAVRSQVRLMDKRNFLEDKVREAKRAVPRDGTVEGPAGLMMSRKGGLSVKRFGGLLGMREEYHILGTFTMSPLCDEF